jgi:hypothetical protein
MSEEDNRYMQNGVSWIESSNIAFLLEIKTAKVLPLLPQGVVPVEVRPGVATIFSCTIAFPAGNLDRYGAFTEIDWAVLVQPHQGIPMPQPSYYFFMGNVGSPCRPFLEYTQAADKMPTYYAEDLEATSDNSTGLNTASDGRGPIFDLQVQIPKIKIDYKKSTL